MKLDLDYRQLLLKELETRRVRNPKYNLSSFARLLDLSPSRLSEILRGKVGLSIGKASDIGEALKLSPTDKNLFLDLVCIEHGRSPREKEAALKRLRQSEGTVMQFDEENFKSISDWYHHAIVELIGLKPNLDIAGISASFNLDLQVTHQAIERLLKLEVIEENETAGYNLAAPVRRTTNGVPSDAIKALNVQILEKASDAIYDQGLNNRDFSVTFMGINKEQLPLAKERITEFRRSFMKEFEGALGKDAVYSLGVQFFELTEAAPRE